jgi:hypothetical protein
VLDNVGSKQEGNMPALKEYYKDKKYRLHCHPDHYSNSNFSNDPRAALDYSVRQGKHRKLGKARRGVEYHLTGKDEFQADRDSRRFNVPDMSVPSITKLSDQTYRCKCSGRKLQRLDLVEQ